VSNPSPAVKACSCGVLLLITALLGCIIFLLQQRRTDRLRALETSITAFIFDDSDFLVLIFDSLFVMVFGRIIDTFCTSFVLRLAMGASSVIEMEGKTRPGKRKERTIESLYLFLCIPDSGDGDALGGTNN
jgi:hypothetical protein